MAIKKNKPTDGLGPLEVAKIRSALRQVWFRSRARKLTVDRCTDEEGYTFCERCLDRTPALKVDHIVTCGEMAGIIERMFCTSGGLEGLCHECHKRKTATERGEARSKKKAAGV